MDLSKFFRRKTSSNSKENGKDRSRSTTPSRDARSMKRSKTPEPEDEAKGRRALRGSAYLESQTKDKEEAAKTRNRSKSEGSVNSISDERKSLPLSGEASPIAAEAEKSKEGRHREHRKKKEPKPKPKPEEEGAGSSSPNEASHSPASSELEGEKEKKSKKSKSRKPSVPVSSLEDLYAKDPESKPYIVNTKLSEEEIMKDFQIMLNIVGFRRKINFFVENTTVPEYQSTYHNLDADSRFMVSNVTKSTRELVTQGTTDIFQKKKMKKIGKGGFASVFSAYVKGDKLKPKLPSQVAIKIQKHSTKREMSRNLTEIKVLSKCKHPNIVTFYRAYLHDYDIWMVMEFMMGGTLSEARSKYTFDEFHIAFVAAELLKGLKYIHSEGIAHRDLKSENVMMTVKGEVKMVDFGLVSDVSKEKKISICGSPFWMPPEMIQRKPHGPNVDLWSLAVCLLELANGHPPNQENSVRAMFMVGVHGNPDPFDKPDKWSTSMKNFFSICLSMNPDDRTSAAELLKHKYLKRACPQATMKGILKTIFLEETLNMF